MMQRMCQLLGGMTLCVSLSAGAADDQAAAEVNRQLGAMVGRFLQASYLLEALTTGECAKYALRPHSAKPDYSDILARLPQVLRAEPREVEEMLEKLAPARREYAERELARVSQQLAETGGSLELRCGILLGMVSVGYLETRAVWAGFNHLEQPVWQRP